MFEKVSRSLKYDSKFFFVHKHMDTTYDHFTPLALHVRGNNVLRGTYSENCYEPLLSMVAPNFRITSLDLKKSNFLNSSSQNCLIMDYITT